MLLPFRRICTRAGIPGHPGQILLAGQPGLMPGQPGLIHGQPGLIPGHPGLMQAHPGLIPGQPGLIPGQQAIIPGQPGVIPGQAGLMPGLMAANPHMMLGAPQWLTTTGVTNGTNARTARVYGRDVATIFCWPHVTAASCGSKNRHTYRQPDMWPIM